MGKQTGSIFKKLSSLLKKPFVLIFNAVKAATKPLRNSGVWRLLRRTILRSPFKGYFVNSFKELKHVTWPDRKTAWKLTFTVVLFSVIFSALTSALDYGFERLAKQLFLS